MAKLEEWIKKYSEDERCLAALKECGGAEGLRQSPGHQEESKPAAAALEFSYGWLSGRSCMAAKRSANPRPQAQGGAGEGQSPAGVELIKLPQQKETLPSFHQRRAGQQDTHHQTPYGVNGSSCVRSAHRKPRDIVNCYSSHQMQLYSIHTNFLWNADDIGGLCNKCNGGGPVVIKAAADQLEKDIFEEKKVFERLHPGVKLIPKFDNLDGNYAKGNYAKGSDKLQHACRCSDKAQLFRRPGTHDAKNSDSRIPPPKPSSEYDHNFSQLWADFQKIRSENPLLFKHPDNLLLKLPLPP